MGDLPGRLRRFRSVVRRTHLPPPGEIGRGERTLVVLVRFLIQMGRQFARDRCPRQAASLAFQTLLAFVPLAVVLLALTRWVERLGDRPAVQRLLERFLVPQSAGDLAARLDRLVEQVDFGTIGIVGALTLVPLGGMLFLQIEDVLNDIWRVRAGRPLWQRAAVLVGINLVALPVLAAAVYLSVERLAFPLDALVPALLAWGALTLIYKLMPHVRVRWRNALAGALAATLLFGLGRAGFAWYLDQFRWGYEGLYGAIAFVPVSLLWVYLGWVVFLLGVEVSYTGQHLDLLWARARRPLPAAAMDADPVPALAWTRAVLVAAAVADGAARAAAPVEPGRIALRLGLGAETVRILAAHLERLGVLRRDVEGRLEPARPPETFRLDDLHAALHAALAPGPILEPALLAARRALGDVTLRDLLPHLPPDPV